MRLLAIALILCAISATLPVIAEPTKIEPPRNLVDNGYCIPDSFNLKSLVIVCRGERQLALLHVRSLFPRGSKGESAARYRQRLDAHVERVQALFGAHLLDRGVYKPKERRLYILQTDLN